MKVRRVKLLKMPIRSFLRVESYAMSAAAINGEAIPLGVL
jgi:hypothetical protein